KGDVHIDLGANPSGLTAADQTTPSKLSNPIHLKTRDLVFNRDSSNASTHAKVEFQTPQASGSAVGMEYSGKTNTLTLASEIQLVMSGEDTVIRAERGMVTNEPRQIVLDHPALKHGSEWLSADSATLELGSDNNVEHVSAQGNISAKETMDSSASAQASFIQARANEGEVAFESQNHVHIATLKGDVHFERTGPRPLQGEAGQVAFDFSSRNEVKNIHARDGVLLTQLASGAVPAKGSELQSFELTASAVDFAIEQGRILQRAVTSGKSQIRILATEKVASLGDKARPQRTVITAGRFDAKFEQTPEGQSGLTLIHGAPEAKIVSSNPGQPDRVSTSDSVAAEFLPRGGIKSVSQQGHVFYTDGQPAGQQTEAYADQVLYTPGDQMLDLKGQPRVMQGSMTTTANTIRINRSSGDAIAEGEVKSTYNQLQERPSGALLASSSPIHVTSSSMIAHSKPALATYSGNARLWQDANIIQAPSIEFDRECRCLTAQGTPNHTVETSFAQQRQPAYRGTSSGKNHGSGAEHSTVASPIFLTGNRLTYADSERRVHYDGGVSARGMDFTASARTMDLFLRPRTEPGREAGKTATTGVSAPAQLDKIVAQGDVIIQQPGRRATGQNLVYEGATDKFTLMGGPPSIFDAERGKITGVSLTFFRTDDRVLVEGESSSPVVTQTRVAR
ncbi:MAG TPA: LptA/OstA family protein, partial [Candidatus Sulfotelmatobacter sp.]